MKSIASDVARKLHQQGYALKLSAQDWNTIHAYDWPGNVRQFINVLKRAAYLKEPLNRLIEEERQTTNITAAGDGRPRMFTPTNESEALPARKIYGAYLEHVYKLCGENVARAAQVLDVAPNTLRKYIGDHGKDNSG